MSKGRQVIILELSDGTIARFYGHEQIRDGVSVTRCVVRTRASTRRHQWDKIGESLWECRGCGAEGAGYHPEQFLSPACPGKEGA